jgi:hypothetical protein
VNENKELNFYDQRRLLAQARLGMVVEKELQNVQEKAVAEKHAIKSDPKLQDTLAGWKAEALGLSFLGISCAKILLTILSQNHSITTQKCMGTMKLGRKSVTN